MATTKKYTAPGSARDGPSLSFIVFRSGNNTDPIRRALLARSTWTSADAEEVKRDPCWTANFVWKPTWSTPKPGPSSWVRGHANPLKRQIFNHLKAVEPLCAKDSLFELMLAYYKAIGEDPTRHLPHTYLVEPRAKEDCAAWPGWKEFEEHFRRCGADASSKNLWLAKPTCLNRGIGIEVFREMDDIVTFLQAKARQASMGIHTVWVLQKYIENPLLFNNRKFDFRVWVLVTDTGDVYMHAPGYVRTSSETFDLSSTDRFAHLTNYCQQVNAASFGMFEEGNTLTFMELEEYLTKETLPKLRAKHAADARPAADSEPDEVIPAAEAEAPKKRKGKLSAGDKPIYLAEDGEEAMWGCGRFGLWGQMRATVIDAFEALRGRGGAKSQGYEENGFGRKPPAWMSIPAKPVSAAEGAGLPAGSGSGVFSGSAPGSAGYPCGNAAGSVGPSGTRHRYELLGLDFIADDDLNLYFIEVNTNPSLSYQNAWHEKFVDAMAVKMLNIVLDGVFPDPPAPVDDLFTTSSPGKWRPAEEWQFLSNVYTASWKLPAQSAATTAAELCKPKPAPAPEPAVPIPPLPSRTKPPMAAKATSLDRKLKSESCIVKSVHLEEKSLPKKIPASPLAPVPVRSRVPARQLAATSIVTLMPSTLGLTSDPIREMKAPPSVVRHVAALAPPQGRIIAEAVARGIVRASSSLSPHRGFSAAAMGEGFEFGIPEEIAVAKSPPRAVKTPHPRSSPLTTRPRPDTVPRNLHSSIPMSPMRALVGVPKT